MIRSFAALSVTGDIDLTSLHPSESNSADITVRTVDRATASLDPSWQWIDDTESHLRRAALVGSTLLMEFDLDGLVHVDLDPVLGEIRVHNEGGVDAIGLEHLVANQALPLYASLVGLTVLHGSAVEVRGGAVIALGDSGAGKSTFASHLVENGGRLLTDDSAVIELATPKPLVYPVSRSVRLYDDSVNEAFSHRAPTSSVGTHTDKQHLVFRDDQIVHGIDPRPVLAIFELGQDACHPPRSIPSSERLSLLDRSMLGFLTPDERPRQARFDRLLDLSVAIPMYEIGIEWTPEGTRQSVDQVLELIGTIRA